MPNELYLIRLIHLVTRTSAPGERFWTGTQLSQGSIVSFLRNANRQGLNVYIHPYAERRNAGYILVDLDHAGSHFLPTMPSLYFSAALAREHRPRFVFLASC